MNFSQENSLSYEGDVDWAELLGNFTADPVAESTLEASSLSPTSTILQGPMGLDPNHQDGGYGCYGTPVAAPVMWNDSSSNASSYNDQFYSNAAHIEDVPSRTLMVNEAIDVKPVVSPAPNYGDAPLPWYPSSSFAPGQPSWSSSGFSEVVPATPSAGSFIPRTPPHHSQSAPVAVASSSSSSSSSGKRKAPPSRPSSRKVVAATAGTSKSSRLNDSEVLAPVQEPRNEDAEAGGDMPRPKQYLHELDPLTEPDKKERARIRSAIRCKLYRDKMNSKSICPGCLAMCEGSVKKFKQMQLLLEYHSQCGQHNS